MNNINRRAKIVCTLGPASTKEEVLKEMIKNGLNVARVNFSHGTDETHIDTINLLKKCSKDLDTFVGILADLKGPKIRVGKFENGFENFKKGEEVNVYLKEVLGNHNQFSINQPELFKDVKVGNTLLVDDGKVVLSIIESKEDFMKVRVENDGVISDNKGINSPGVVLTMPFVSDKDYHDLLIAIDNKVNFVASSFVRRPSDVLEIRKILDDNGGKDIDIISKIENQEGLDNIEEIIKVSNGIMVARGDMGVEVPLESVPVYQKKIIKLCNQYGRPVITATHMLESMIHCPRPTRAEAGDVANAVLDGTDAVMLSGESAVGDYPIEAVSTMRSIIEKIESISDYKEKFKVLSNYSNRTINDAIGISVASCCLNLQNSKCIFAFTETGGTARRISHYRPSLPIIGCTDSVRSCNRMCLYWGVYPYLVRKANSITDFDEIVFEESKKMGLKKNDLVIITNGFGVEHGMTNTIRLIEI